ncbi:MAG: hypothetical protein WKG07_45710 [Hymenobacter sp.]
MLQVAPPSVVPYQVHPGRYAPAGVDGDGNAIERIFEGNFPHYAQQRSNCRAPRQAPVGRFEDARGQAIGAGRV